MKLFFCIFLFNLLLISTTSQGQTQRNRYTYQAAQVEFGIPMNGK